MRHTTHCSNVVPIRQTSRRGSVDHSAGSGYIKLFRALEEAPFSDQPDYWACWTHLMMMATHRPYQTVVRGQTVDLQPGQLITGRSALARRVGLSEQTVRTVLAYFEREGWISREHICGGTRITLHGYVEEQACQPVEQPAPASPDISPEIAARNGQKINQQPTSQINQPQTPPQPLPDVACSETATDGVTSQPPAQSTTIQENNNYKTTTRPPAAQVDGQAGQNSNVPFHRIAELYNQIMSAEFPRCLVPDSGKRKPVLRKFWQHMKQDISQVRRYFEYVNLHASPFMRGEGPRGWVADIEYLCRENTLVRAQEGTL
ncbi:MAG: hypothetical protein OIF57_04610 [Marinobacterium sp.]|nr:hypothetical protein [Marinobacterium sp.]